MYGVLGLGPKSRAVPTISNYFSALLLVAAKKLFQNGLVNLREETWLLRSRFRARCSKASIAVGVIAHLENYF
jgi:hypothetical protein